MEVLGIVMMIYGILCVAIGLLKPPMIWNMAKFKVMEKMMGKIGLRVFVLVWGIAFIVIGYIIK